MATQNHTFTADETAVSLGSHSGRYSQLVIGEVGHDTFGGGTLLIQKSTLSGGVHTIRSITAADFSSMQDKTLRLELTDATTCVVSLSGSTNPDLYVEHRNQQDR